MTHSASLCISCPGESQSMLHAGTESSATTVVWAMSELVVHPEIMHQAQSELDAVIGTTRLVQESDLPNLPFLSAIIKETFRLHPPVPLSLPRSSNQPCVIASHEFPANTRLILNIFAIHRDPSVYKDPERFEPSRFMERPEIDHMSGQGSYELIPFGVGRRMCPASHLGNTMVSLMLANLVHSFEWSLPRGGSAAEVDMAEVYKLVGLRKEALVLVAKPRSPAFLY